MNSLKRAYENLRSSFWFLPAVMTAASMLLAFALIEADSSYFDQQLQRWPRLFGVDAQGARQLLSTLAGSMITVMGITFSMTLLALTVASEQYTPRVLRNFMRSRVTQSTLGVFASIFAFCLIVLRTIREADEAAEFVPNLAVFVAFVMSLGGVGILIYFIHHIASSIQAPSIIASISHETNAAMDRLLLATACQDATQASPKKHEVESLYTDRRWYAVPANESGYVLQVDSSALVRIASDHKTIACLQRAIGDFVVQGTPLGHLSLAEPPDEEVVAAVNRAFGIGRHRTVAEDPTFGIRQIVDIALKALSPGINNTSTAIICVDYLMSILARLTDRGFPSDIVYQEKVPRLVMVGLSFERLLGAALDEIRASAGSNAAILLRLIDAINTIASLSNVQEQRVSLRAQIERTAEAVDRSVMDRHERATLHAAIAGTKCQHQ